MEYQGKTLIDYIDILKKDYKLFLVPFVFILGLTIIFALTLPSVYRSQGKILVESQQIPDDLIRSTITSYADERIQVIRQLVMTRENLLRIIQKYRLYGTDGSLPKHSAQELLDRIKKNIYIELIQGQTPPRARNRRNSLTFIVAFEDTNPQTARDVANELVTLFLKENLKSRTQRATETTEFLTAEAEKLRQQINIIEQQVAEYKQKHEKSLPENLSLNNQMLERAQTTLREIQRDIKAEEEQLSYLEVQLATLRSTVPDDDETPLTPAQQLILLKNRLAELRQRYAERHPDIRKLKRQIAELESTLEDSATSPAGSPDLPAAMLINAKIRATREKIASLQQQENELRDTIHDLEQRLLQTPQVERGLKALERDYENLRAKYDDLMDKATEANLSQSMEEQSKAERFTLIETPIYPEEPVRPDRLKILVVGFILSFAGGAGLVLAKDELKGGIRNIRQLSRISHAVPLVAIGYIDNSTDLALKRKHRRNAILLLFVLTITVLAILHFSYKPLDEIAEIILKRF